jgi:transposase
MQPLFDLPAPEPVPSATPGSGKPRLARAQRTQVEMRLAALDDLLPPDHLARVIWGLIEQIDLSAFYAPIRAVEGQAGHPAIDPAILIALWLYATAEGVGSARALDRLCTEHIAYQWLCGGVSVNYHTLADFRVAHERALDECLTQHVAALMAEGLVSLERTAQDGVRIRASAGSGSFRRRERLEQFQTEAQARVEQLKAQAQADGDPRSPRQQAAQERAGRERLKRVQQAVREMGELEQRRAKDHQKKSERKPPRVSTTDPEARVIKMPGGGYQPAYNGQLAVETGSGVIVGVDVTAQVDQGQIGPMLDQLAERYAEQPNEHLVDGGFVAHSDIETAADQGVAVYAPLPAPRAQDQDPTQPRATDGPGVRAWRERMQTEAAKTIYKLRAQTVEWANAGLRQRGLYQFEVRGRQKVRAVLLWFALLHNLLRSVRLRAARPTVATG